MENRSSKENEAPSNGRFLTISLTGGGFPNVINYLLGPEFLRFVP
jgi:hypothetical protein